jgi:hypothetical protein
MNYLAKTLNTNEPWRLNFAPDGTRDIAILSNRDGHDLVRSAPFHRPNPGEPTPEILASIWLMSAAPQLFRALEIVLSVTFEVRQRQDLALDTQEEAAQNLARQAMAQALGTRSEDHVMLFSDADEGRMLGIVFENSYHVAVLQLDKLALGNITFGDNSWRGDRYEPLLRQAIQAHREHFDHNISTSHKENPHG